MRLLQGFSLGRQLLLQLSSALFRSLFLLGNSLSLNLHVRKLSIQTLKLAGLLIAGLLRLLQGFGLGGELLLQVCGALLGGRLVLGCRIPLGRQCRQLALQTLHAGGLLFSGKLRLLQGFSLGRQLLLQLSLLLLPRLKTSFPNLLKRAISLFKDREAELDGP